MNSITVFGKTHREGGPAQDRSEFCVLHTCQGPGCRKEARTRSRLCDVHTCKSSTCVGFSDHSAGMEYCIAHQCNVEGCFEPNSEPGGACKMHECPLPACKNPAGHEPYFHGEAVALCLPCTKEPTAHSACGAHACTAWNCGRRIQEDKVLCETHS